MSVFDFLSFENLQSLASLVGLIRSVYFSVLWVIRKYKLRKINKKRKRKNLLTKPSVTNEKAEESGCQDSSAETKNAS